MTGPYEARFAFTDDAELDAATLLLEHTPMTLEEIFAACRRYGVRAQVIEGGKLVGEFVPTR